MKSQRRILYVVNAFETDAPTSITASVGKAMADAGWLVKYVAWSRGGPLEKSLSANGAGTIVLGSGIVAGALKLANIIKDFSPSIVHVTLARPTIGVGLTRMLVGKTDTRWLVSDHGVHEWQEKGRVVGAGMSGLMPAVLSTMDAVVTVSANAALELTRRGVAESKIQVVPNGVDVTRYYPRARGDRRPFLMEHFPNDTPDEVFLVGAAGNLRPVKGFDVLVEAMSLVLQRLPMARCLIWGRGPELNKLRRQAEALKVEDKVIFAGYEGALEERLPLLDVYVQPSRAESFGMAAAEAMACGVPVVVANVGGLTSLIQHGRSGRVFTAGSASSLADEIVHMASKEERQRNGNAGRLRVLQYFTQQGMVDNFQAVYSRLLGAEPLQ